MFKYRFSNKHSVLLGPNVRVLKTDGSVGDVSLFSTFGYQYNITEDFFLEAKVDYNLLKTAPINFINPTNSTDGTGDYVIYKVGAKLKF